MCCAIGLAQLDIAGFKHGRFALDKDELSVTVALHGGFGNEQHIGFRFGIDADRGIHRRV